MAKLSFLCTWKIVKLLWIAYQKHNEIILQNSYMEKRLSAIEKGKVVEKQANQSSNNESTSAENVSK